MADAAKEESEEQKIRPQNLKSEVVAKAIYELENEGRNSGRRYECGRS